MKKTTQRTFSFYKKLYSAPQTKIKQRTYTRILKRKKSESHIFDQAAFDFEMKTIRLSFITFCRLHKKISQETLAKLIGVSRVTVWLWENKRTKKIPEQSLAKLTSFFGAPSKNFKRVIDVPQETFDRINYNHAGCKRLEGHEKNKNLNTEKTKENSNDRVNVILSSSYNKLLSCRWK